MKTIEAKIVVLGAQGVGKTSMVVRYIGRMFSHHISPTIGASFFTCKINIEDTRVKLQEKEILRGLPEIKIWPCHAGLEEVLQIFGGVRLLPQPIHKTSLRMLTRIFHKVWDTAGQERFKSMAPMYYRNANAALLVFDITQYESFTAVQTWVKELQRNVVEPMVLSVIGNKTDLSEQRKVSREEAFQYAQSIGGNYFESSALHDEGIEEVFLNTAVGLIRLSEDSVCSSLRVYDSADSVNPRPNVLRDVPILGTPATESAHPYIHTDIPLSTAHAEVERSSPCC